MSYEARPYRIVFGGLPASLRENQHYVYAMFEQMGLEDEFLRSRQRDEKLEVEVRSYSAVQLCCAHFRSVCWRPYDHGRTCDAICVGCVDPEESGEAWDDAADFDKDAESDTGSRSTELKSEDEGTSSGSSTSELLFQASTPWQPQERVRSLSRGRAASCERGALRGRLQPTRAVARRLTGVPVVVNYIPREASDARLVALCARFGKVVSASVMRDRQGVSKCYGFVNFAEHAGAAAVIEACQAGRVRMKDAQGKRWHVKATWSKSDAALEKAAPQPCARADTSLERRRPLLLERPAPQRKPTRASSCGSQLARTMDWADVESDEEEVQG